MRKLAQVLVAVLVVSLVGLSPASAGNKPGNSPNAKKCQKTGYLSLITSTGAGFGSAAECSSYAAGGGIILPLAGLACFSGGWVNVIRDDASTFADQDACTGYIAQPGKKLYLVGQEKCVEPGWVLRNKTTDATVVRGTEDCLALLAAANLTGAKLTTSYDEGNDAVDVAVSAFGVAPADDSRWGSCFTVDTDPYSALDSFDTTNYLDPWAWGGTSCSTDSDDAVPIGSAGTYAVSRSYACPTGPLSVDHVGAVTSWGQGFAFAGSLNSAWNNNGWIYLAVSWTQYCGPLGQITNSGPTAVDDAITVGVEGTCFDGIALSANDTDPEGNQLRVAPYSAGGSSHGAVSSEEDLFQGSFQAQVCYYPDGSDATSDSFTYVVEDRGGLNDVGSVAVTIDRG